MTPETRDLILERDELLDAVYKTGVDGGEMASLAICTLEAFDRIHPLPVKSLRNWAVVTSNNPYLAPELRTSRLAGDYYIGDKLQNELTTSSIQGMIGKYHVVTRTGSVYELKDIDPEYEKLYPNAHQRLVQSAPKL